MVLGELRVLDIGRCRSVADGRFDDIDHGCGPVFDVVLCPQQTPATYWSMECLDNRGTFSGFRVLQRKGSGK